MTKLLVASVLFALCMAYPLDMGREKCESDGIYWKIHAGDMIPCSPTCDQTYVLTDKNEVTEKTINKHCKLNTSVGKHYHDIANNTMCTCTNGAAYKELSSIEWSSLSQVSRWFCIPLPQWDFQLVGPNSYKVVCR